MNIVANPFAFAFLPQTSFPKVLQKITRSDIGISLPRLDDKEKPGLQDLIEQYRAVYVLLGRVSDTKLVKGKGDEPGVRFVGQFKAIVNPALPNTNGHYFISSRMHVPRFYEEVLYTAVLQGKHADKDSLLEFMIGVGLKPPKDGKPSAVGYEWTIEPLVDTNTADDPVDALLARAKQRVALPAPATAAQNAAEDQRNNGLVTDEAPIPATQESERQHHRRGR